MTRVVLIDCDFCGERRVPYGGLIVGSLARTRWTYCKRCWKPGQAYKACVSVEAAERVRLARRLVAALQRGPLAAREQDAAEFEPPSDGEVEAARLYHEGRWH